MTTARRFTPGRIAFFILVVAIVLAIDASRKIPEPPASGDSLLGPAPATQPAPDSLRVATYNIDGGVGHADQKLDLDRTASALKGFDLIALQEVHGSITGVDQSQILGQKLNLQYLYAPVERQFWHDAFGDAILSDLPATHWQRFPLASANADSNRELLWTQLKWNGKTLNVLITHLERHSDNAPELKTAITLFQSLQTPAILLGDLNAGKDNPQIAALRQDPSVSDPIGNSLSDKYKDSVDWIFARGLKSTSAGFTDNSASDHPLAWAEFKLPD